MAAKSGYRAGSRSTRGRSVPSPRIVVSVVLTSEDIIYELSFCGNERADTGAMTEHSTDDGRSEGSKEASTRSVLAVVGPNLIGQVVWTVVGLIALMMYIVPTRSVWEHFGFSVDAMIAVTAAWYVPYRVWRLKDRIATTEADAASASRELIPTADRPDPSGPYVLWTLLFVAVTLAAYGAMVWYVQTRLGISGFNALSSGERLLYVSPIVFSFGGIVYQFDRVIFANCMAGGLRVGPLLWDLSTRLPLFLIDINSLDVPSSPLAPPYGVFPDPIGIYVGVPFVLVCTLPVAYAVLARTPAPSADGPLSALAGRVVRSANPNGTRGWIPDPDAFVYPDGDPKSDPEPEPEPEPEPAVTRPDPASTRDRPKRPAEPSNGRPRPSAEGGDGESAPAAEQRGLPDQIQDPPDTTFDDVVGLEDVKSRLREDVVDPFTDPAFEQFGVSGVNGVLLHGPPGTGKTYSAKAVAGELGINFLPVKISDVTSSKVGEAPQRIRELFEMAREYQPCLVFLDEFDAIATDRGGDTSMTRSERQTVNTLLDELSESNERDDDVLVVAATNELDDVDDAIKRTGRFDTTIEIGLPDGETRTALLERELDDLALQVEADIGHERFVRETEGFTASDVTEIAAGAARSALSDAENDRPTITGEHVFDRIADLSEKRDQDTAADLLAERPDVSFDDVAGREETKAELRRKIVEPLRNPERFEEFGLGTVNGVLLCGPPGTGKTYLSKALAGELGYNYIELSTSDVTSRWIGQGEENVRELFEKAREIQPCVVLLDELDSIAPSREGDRMHQSQKQVVNELLNQLTEIQGEDVVVIGTTNLAAEIDDAMTRSGRLDERIEVAPADRETQVEVLRYHLADRPLAEESIDWELIATLLGTDDAGASYVAADLEAIADEAARNAMAEATADDEDPRITGSHVTEAIESATSSLRE